MNTIRFQDRPIVGGTANRAVRAVQEYEIARRECAATVPDTLACDGAIAVYSEALGRLGVPDATIQELARAGVSAVRTTFLARRRNGRPVLAADSASTRKARETRFPNAHRLG